MYLQCTYFPVNVEPQEEYKMKFASNEQKNIKWIINEFDLHLFGRFYRLAKNRAKAWKRKEIAKQMNSIVPCEEL